MALTESENSAAKAWAAEIYQILLSYIRNGSVTLGLEISTKGLLSGMWTALIQTAATDAGLRGETFLRADLVKLAEAAWDELERAGSMETIRAAVEQVSARSAARGMTPSELLKAAASECDCAGCSRDRAARKQAVH